MCEKLKRVRENEGKTPDDARKQWMPEDIYEYSKPDDGDDREATSAAPFSLRNGIRLYSSVYWPLLYYSCVIPYSIYYFKLDESIDIIIYVYSQTKTAYLTINNTKSIWGHFSCYWVF